jgi:hypothetical protein
MRPWQQGPCWSPHAGMQPRPSPTAGGAFGAPNRTLRQKAHAVGFAGRRLKNEARKSHLAGSRHARGAPAEGHAGAFVRASRHRHSPLRAYSAPHLPEPADARAQRRKVRPAAEGPRGSPCLRVPSRPCPQRAAPPAHPTRGPFLALQPHQQPPSLPAVAQRRLGKQKQSFCAAHFSRISRASSCRRSQPSRSGACADAAGIQSLIIVPMIMQRL